VIVWASDDNPRRRAQIDTLNQLHPDYLLQLDAVNQDIDKVVTQSLAGVGPDAFDAYRDKLALLHEAGLLHDITEPLAARGITLDTFWPLVMIKSEHLKTLPVGMLFFNGLYEKQTNLMMAPTVMNIVPLIVLFVTCQKFLVRGIQLGAVKG
jgi:hypothetical protein